MLSRGTIVVATVASIESRVVDREFWLQISRAVKAFSCSGAGKEAFGVGLGWEGVDDAWRGQTAERGGVGKGLKRKKVEQRGGRAIIDVESGGWPVHAPCLVAKPGGANTTLQIITLF